MALRFAIEYVARSNLRSIVHSFCNGCVTPGNNAFWKVHHTRANPLLKLPGVNDGDIPLNVRTTNANHIYWCYGVPSFHHKYHVL